MTRQPTHLGDTQRLSDDDQHDSQADLEGMHLEFGSDRCTLNVTVLIFVFLEGDGSLKNFILLIESTTNEGRSRDRCSAGGALGEARRGPSVDGVFLESGLGLGMVSLRYGIEDMYRHLPYQESPAARGWSR